MAVPHGNCAGWGFKIAYLSSLGLRRRIPSIKPLLPLAHPDESLGFMNVKPPAPGDSCENEEKLSFFPAEIGFTKRRLLGPSVNIIPKDARHFVRPRDEVIGLGVVLRPELDFAMQALLMRPSAGSGSGTS